MFAWQQRGPVPARVHFEGKADDLRMGNDDESDNQVSEQALSLVDLQSGG